MAEKRAVGTRNVMCRCHTRDQMAVTRANLPLFVRNSLCIQNRNNQDNIPPPEASNPTPTDPEICNLAKAQDTDFKNTNTRPRTLKVLYQ